MDWVCGTCGSDIIQTCGKFPAENRWETLSRERCSNTSCVCARHQAVGWKQLR